MNEQATSCPRESDTIAAIRSGVWGNDLTTHLNTCDQCRSAKQMSSSLHVLAEDTLRLPHRLPDYRVLWLKAQYRQRQQVVRRREAVMMIGGSVIAAFITVIAVLKWETLAGALRAMAVPDQSALMGSPITVAIIMAGLGWAWILFADKSSEH